MDKSGKIYVVGLGPGDREHMTLAAMEAIKNSEVIIGYKTYIELVKDLIQDQQIISSGMKREVERCELTLNYANQGKTVALISSGDAGIYGMAGIMMEVLINNGCQVDVEIVPGVTAANAGAACVGAPIMHDYVTISLSDLLTDWELIKKRLHCAGEGDFVVALYNPKSKGRQEQIKVARDILLTYKSGGTPVAIIKNAKRQGERWVITDLKHMLEHEIDMVTTLIIGNSMTYIKNGKMITPRGYRL